MEVFIAFWTKEGQTTEYILNAHLERINVQITLRVKTVYSWKP